VRWDGQPGLVLELGRLENLFEGRSRGSLISCKLKWGGGLARACSSCGVLEVEVQVAVGMWVLW